MSDRVFPPVLRQWTRLGSGFAVVALLAVFADVGRPDRSAGRGDVLYGNTLFRNDGRGRFTEQSGPASADGSVDGHLRSPFRISTVRFRSPRQPRGLLSLRNLGQPRRPRLDGKIGMNQ